MVVAGIAKLNAASSATPTREMKYASANAAVGTASIATKNGAVSRSTVREMDG
jgi:hypothetical protein